MKRALGIMLKLGPALLTIALVGSSQLSCSVNDYCLNCDNGDGGNGSGSDGGGMDDGGDASDAMIDAACVPTGGPEECNGKDDDCNGLVDDNTSDEGQPCTNQNGACAGGVTFCDTGGVLKCTKTAKPETCNAVDDNCSGPVGTGNGVDEGDPSPPAAVGMPELDNVNPNLGQCGNGLDDDGDGTADDGCPGSGSKCGTEQGECTAGQWHCDPLTGVVSCFGFIDHTSDPEICNGKDDNCNGQFDENITFQSPQCGPATDVGSCEFGTKACMGGQVVCNGAVFPAFDVCNDADDDCDGVIDQNTNKLSDINNCGACNNVCPTRANANTTCTPVGTPPNQMGQCGYTCKPGYKDLNGLPGDGCEFGPCFPTGTVEECDGLDNNCNGQTDEGLTPPPICKAGGECGTVAPTATCGLPGMPGTGSMGWICTYPSTVQFPETKCDGLDNDCDGNADEFQTNLNQACNEDREDPATQCADAVDSDNDGKVNDGCPAAGSETGTQCDDAVDSDSDGKINDGCAQVGTRKEAGAECDDNADSDSDGKVNDGCPAAGSETGAQCDDAVDSDGDGVVNDGCPAVAQKGQCKGSGAYKCDPLNLDGPAYCQITTPGQAPDLNETCDAKDNDCDGKTDEGGTAGTLLGQEWVDLGNGHSIMRYEASRPDATLSDQGANNTLVCSRQSVQPWTNVKYQDAEAACASIGATLCSEQNWHRACSVVTGVNYVPPTGPPTVSTTGTYVEAEDYSGISNGESTTPQGETSCADRVDNDSDGFLNDGCATVGAAETNCTNVIDDDGDGTVNDGCPARGPIAETTCNENPNVLPGAIDNDLDGVINDGCATVGGAPEVNCRDGIDDDGDGTVNDGCPATGPAWIPDYTSGFSGISAMEVTPNLGVAVTTAANAPSQSARLDFNLNFTTTGTYHVWVKMYADTLNDDMVWVGMSTTGPAAPQTTARPTLTSCTTSNDCSNNTSCVDTNGNGSADTCTPRQIWQWVETAVTFSVPATGNRVVSIYMNEDGAKIDKIYLATTTTNPGTAEVVAGPGNKWAYSSSPNTYQPNVCNGHDYRQVGVSMASRAASGVVTVTTSASHPFVVGDLVQILGTSQQRFEGTYTVTSVGSATTFTYQQNLTTVETATGGTATEARDPVLTTKSLTSCYSTIGGVAGTGAYDMSGNVREWTLAHSPGENPIRGGASNGTANGISCPLNFTLADDTFFFPNIGFRCCK